jgi:hypothetical protein
MKKHRDTDAQGGKKKLTDLPQSLKRTKPDWIFPPAVRAGERQHKKVLNKSRNPSLLGSVDI